MEDFVGRYRNIAMAGPNYFMFASRPVWRYRLSNRQVQLLSLRRIPKLFPILAIGAVLLTPEMLRSSPLIAAHGLQGVTSKSMAESVRRGGGRGGGRGFRGGGGVRGGIHRGYRGGV